MFFRVLFPMPFLKVNHSMYYQVSHYFHFMMYNHFIVNVEKVFISSKILIFLHFRLNYISDFTLNISPEKLYHTIWFIISKTDMFCQEWENNQYDTLNAAIGFYVIRDSNLLLNLINYGENVYFFNTVIQVLYSLPVFRDCYIFT